MIWLLPIINAVFGWSIISILFYFLFHPLRKKNFFIFEMQGFIPKNYLTWGNQAGEYIAENIVNISGMRASLLQSENLSRIHELLEQKVDDFLRTKLKEKIPVFSMFITEGMITKMKEVLVDELQLMVPALIDQIASGVESRFDIRKMITAQLNQISLEELDKQFYRHAGKSIMALKISIAMMGLLLGVIEAYIISV
jgi:uncharacterized membrane protein YheB (UPF0754 family)